MNDTLEKTATILRMIKFSHSLFAMPFALCGAFLAWSEHDGLQQPGRFAAKLALIVLCMVTARSVAMTFNRIVDVRFDADNPRTADRALVRKLVSMRAAWTFLIANAAGFIAATAGFAILFGNFWPLVFAVPVLGFLCAYSLSKRFTILTHFWLGAALGLAPLGAWVAVAGLPETQLSVPLLLGAAVLLWTAGFDIIYSLQDVHVDRRQGLFSIPARLGTATAIWAARTCHAMMITALLLLALAAELGEIYLIGVGSAAVLLVIEHLLAAGAEPKRINVAFFNINVAVSVVICVMTIAELLSR